MEIVAGENSCYRLFTFISLKQVNIKMIEVVIGNKCSTERQKLLNKYGIKLILLSIDNVEKIILSLLNIRIKLPPQKKKLFTISL